MTWHAILALTIPLFGQEAVLRLDPAATRVEYTLGDVLHTVRGTFKLKSGEIHFNPATGGAGGLLVAEAFSGDILESAKYPDITFTPDRVEGAVHLQGDSDASVHGAFRTHGADHELVLLVQQPLRGPAGHRRYSLPGALREIGHEESAVWDN